MEKDKKKELDVLIDTFFRKFIGAVVIKKKSFKNMNQYSRIKNFIPLEGIRQKILENFMSLMEKLEKILYIIFYQ